MLGMVRLCVAAVMAALSPGAMAQQSPAMPDEYKVNILIRTTLIALSQANATGNYTVLRDLGAPSFAAKNDAAQLGSIFADLRRRKLDFGPLVFFNPKLIRAPSIEPSGLLRVTGFFETQPERVEFDLMFQNAGAEWQLFGIAVNVRAAVATAPAPAAPQPPGTPAAAGRGAPKKPETAPAAKAATRPVSAKPAAAPATAGGPGRPAPQAAATDAR